MASSLTDLTTYANVRALLGLSVKELPDATLATEVMLIAVKQELAEVNADLHETVVTVKAQASLTAADERLVEAVSLFCAYAAATRCMDAVMNLAPKSVTGAKIGIIRHSDKVPAEMQTKILDQFNTAKRRLQEALATYSAAVISARTPGTLVAAAIPDYDPIVGA